MSLGVIAVSMQLIAARSQADYFCMNKKTKALKAKAACSGKERALDLSLYGVLGPKGDKGDKGDTGDTGSTGAAGANGAAGAAGETGAPGADGADGQLRIYGNSSNDVTISFSEDWTNSNPAYPDMQFRNLMIDYGATLTVPSGTVLRCSGSFVNYGTIVVGKAAKGGKLDIADGASGISSMRFPSVTFPGQGALARNPASFGELGDNSQGRYLGMGGLRFYDAENGLHPAQILQPGIMGGGGGAGSLLGWGGDGGGSLTVLSRYAMTIEEGGGIVASGGDGATGAGGGGGGIIILASPVSVFNGGNLYANGGHGGFAGTGSLISVAGGGGGGGGIIHFISPDISEGWTSVNGGLGDESAIDTGSYHQGGGGGGACGGSGGDGGTMRTDGAESSQDGQDGLVVTTEADPTALF